jgi:hypothetical protein
VSETRHRFCRRHSSWFCPCVASWLYGPAAKAAYENNEPAASAEIFEAAGGAPEDEQFELIFGDEALR